MPKFIMLIIKFFVKNMIAEGFFDHIRLKLSEREKEVNGSYSSPEDIERAIVYRKKYTPQIYRDT